LAADHEAHRRAQRDGDVEDRELGGALGGRVEVGDDDGGDGVVARLADANLGSGRIFVSEIEVPTILVTLV
jgi:hypothetical protein